MRTLLLLSLLGATSLGATPPPATILPPAHGSQAGPAGVDGLTPEDVVKAVGAMKDHFVRPGALTDDEMARATLQGLLDRLAPAVTLTTGTVAKQAAIPFYREALDGKTGYLRLGELSAANIDAAKQALMEWSGTGVGAVVLDLRGTPAVSDFDAGAALAGLFCAKGTEMFSLTAGKRAKAPEANPAITSTASLAISSTASQATSSTASPATSSTASLVTSTTASPESSPDASAETRSFSADADPLFKGILVVLVDSETAEAPEAVAAALQKCAKALVVGDKTAGRVYEYTDVPLTGAVLRVAVAKVILPDGKEPGENGLMPDISVGLGAAGKKVVMRSITARGVASVINERDRPHLNEAALVSGSNPEVDELQAEQAGHKPAEPLIDRQLQRALDLVTSISIYEAKGDADGK